ncbi:Aldehyde Dehydrogenase [Beutenbergia cavernae DSM 12333]|uniref:Aldehyde Dehydrogenase n=1 Tax=Beutenbergia cavernae (strain ATCC BAA-8 / DSM 12333 / CCUG 43141 / JCM 11478 / NBRC 16432 / NCIMB 13614 / HKI 0122) TaxID=471853 RepID=C5BYN8_BEUC1|nr:NAD-dependent succinate-semialdehyde dehydrogenase [Beutenbergia cavernae]ACQ78996.1 Aldehyde Dehydrogenase [Beutenbergia cavernae DSM 12333]
MTDAERTLLSSVPTQLYIAGQWRAASSSATFDVHDPATGDVIAAVADATPEDGEAALAAAHEAQDGWGRTPPRERAELLRAAFDAVTARADDVALLMTLEMGKPLDQSRAEVTYGAEFLRWFSEQAAHIDGGYLRAPNGANRILVVKKPVGPSLLITPWNFPLAMATRKIAPALAAGCTVVIKPASLTPLTTHLFVKVLDDVGVPPGVVNLISTSRSGDVTGPLIADPRLRKLSFTGSTEVGRSLLAAASEQVLRTSMELGGNAPFLVFDDADLEAAVDGAVAAKMRNMGEACTAANRFLVHAAVADEFGRRLADRLGALRLGRGTEDGVDVGPLVEEKARDKVDELVTDARDGGAQVLTGGAVPGGPGWFYPPTVLAGVPEDARLVREEIFGPVAPIVTFSDEDDAVRLANATEYGLVAYAYTRDVSRALRLAERIETGMLGINAGVISDAAAPFGGVKQSGIGREGGSVGIEEYLETTYVGIADPFGP